MTHICPKRYKYVSLLKKVIYFRSKYIGEIFNIYYKNTFLVVKVTNQSLFKVVNKILFFFYEIFNKIKNSEFNNFQIGVENKCKSQNLKIGNKIISVIATAHLAIRSIIGRKPLPTTLLTSERMDFPRSALC